jgi:hypothetical protein
MNVNYEARPVPLLPTRRGQGAGNVGCEFPAKGKKRGKAEAGSSIAGLVKLVDSEATSKHFDEAFFYKGRGGVGGEEAEGR